MAFNLEGFFDGIKTALTELFQKIGDLFGGTQISAGLSVGGGVSGGYAGGGYDGGVGIGIGYGGPALRPLGMVGGRNIGTSVAMGAHFSTAAAGIGLGVSGMAVGYHQARVSHGGGGRQLGVGARLG
ncbi:MAG: hypothetical protein JNK24_05355 [Alphaproteobacteria bacterium]|nr:hypothetical protein [Alphaproteobacteria bacterium]